MYLNLSRALVSDLSETKENVQVGDGPAPEWMVGQGGIGVDQLVLVAVKRISTGSWVPCIRLVGHIHQENEVHKSPLGSRGVAEHQETTTSPTRLPALGLPSIT